MTRLRALSCSAALLLAACVARDTPRTPSIVIAPPSSAPPTPVPETVHGRTLAWGDTLGEIGDLAVDREDVYWTTDDGEVRTVPRAGGPVRTLAKREGNMNSPRITLGRERLYWVERPRSSGAAILSLPRHGGAEPSVVVRDDRIDELTGDDRQLFYATRRAIFSVVPGAEPHRVAEEGNCHALLVDGDYVYWSAYTTIRRAPKGGGPVETLASGMQTDDVVANNGHLYWSTEKLVQRVPEAGGAVETVASERSLIYDVAVSDDYVCWSTDERIKCRRSGSSETFVADAGWYGPRQLVLVGDQLVYASTVVARAVRLDPDWRDPPGPPECPADSLDAGTDEYIETLRHGVGDALFATEGRLSSLALDHDAAYVGDVEKGTIVRVPRVGGAPVTLAQGQSKPTSIAVGPTEVVWTNSGDGTVMKVGKAGGSPTILARDRKEPGAVVFDHDRIYWAEPGEHGDGGVFSVGVGGGAPTILARGIDRPSALALDERFVYATLLASGLLVRIPRGGGEAQPLASSDFASDLALDADGAYWTDSRSGRVYFMPAGGDAAEIMTELGAGTSGTGIRLRLDGARLILANDYGLYSVSKTGGCGARFTPLKIGFGAVALAADGDEIFWVTWSELRKWKMDARAR